MQGEGGGALHYPPSRGIAPGKDQVAQRQGVEAKGRDSRYMANQRVEEGRKGRGQSTRGDMLGTTGVES